MKAQPPTAPESAIASCAAMSVASCSGRPSSSGISASRKGHETGKYLADYIAVLTDALRLHATAKKNANVLFHMAGYFKKRVSEDERKELAEVIESYRRGLVPLIVPVVMIRHYVRKFDEPYLKNQYYLNPHPLELMLRNHV